MRAVRGLGIEKLERTDHGEIFGQKLEGLLQPLINEIRKEAFLEPFRSKATSSGFGTDIRDVDEG